MRVKDAVPILLVLFLLFIVLGDRFLPSPVNRYSLQARTTLNQWVGQLFPRFRPIDINRQRETEVEGTYKDAGQ